MAVDTLGLGRAVISLHTRRNTPLKTDLTPEKKRERESDKKKKKERDRMRNSHQDR